MEDEGEIRPRGGGMEEEGGGAEGGRKGPEEVDEGGDDCIASMYSVEDSSWRRT